MAFPPHYRFRVEGAFRDGQGRDMEMWSNTVNMLHGGTEPLDEDAWLLAHGVPACETLYGQSYISSTVVVTSMKLNAIDGSGHYVDPGVTHELTEEQWSPIRGTSSSYVEPQRALAVSWTTAARRGPAHRGRIYLPGVVSAVGPTLQASVAVIASNARVFLNEINEDPALDAAVVSKTGQGFSNLILGVEVGDRIDTIRRRRNRLQETYAVA